MDARDPDLYAVFADGVDSVADRRLLVLLHGRGADEQDLLPLAGALGAAPGDAVVSLRAPVPWGPGWAWAPGPGGEEPEGDLAWSAAAVLRWLDALPDRGYGRPGEVRLLGFSQGGATALEVLRRDPSRFLSAVVLAGYVLDGVQRGDELLSRLRPPVFWGRGADDDVIGAAEVERLAAWLPEHADATVRVYDGLGHGISDAELADVRAFLAL